MDLPKTMKELLLVLSYGETKTAWIPIISLLRLTAQKSINQRDSFKNQARSQASLFYIRSGISSENSRTIQYVV